MGSTSLDCAVMMINSPIIWLVFMHGRCEGQEPLCEIGSPSIDWDGGIHALKVHKEVPSSSLRQHWPQKASNNTASMVASSGEFGLSVHARVVSMSKVTGSCALVHKEGEVSLLELLITWSNLSLPCQVLLVVTCQKWITVNALVMEDPAV